MNHEHIEYAKKPTQRGRDLTIHYMRSCILMVFLAGFVVPASAAGSVTLSVTTANPMANQPVSFSGTDSVNPNGPVVVFDYNTPDCTHPAIDGQGPMTISGGVFSATFPGTDFPTAGTYSAVAKDVSVTPSVVSSCVTFTVTAGPPPASSATDWAVLSVSLSPSAPKVGDPVTFSMVVTALSSPGSFPQSFAAVCQIDGVSCGGGSLAYPGPMGAPFTVSTQTPWVATVGTHTLTWGVATIPVGLDPNKSNNAMSQTFTVAPQAQFDFSISASPTQQSVVPGGSASYDVTVGLVSGTAQSVALSLSTPPPAGVSVSFTPPSGTPPFSSTLSVTTTSSASPGTITLTISGIGGAASHSASVTLIVGQAADFQIEVSPASQSVSQGQTVSYSVNVAALNGFNSQVSLSVSGLPSGANGVFSNPSATPNFASTLTVTLPSDASTGPYTLTVTGSGGGLSHVANLVLTVNSAIVTQTSTSSTESSAPSTQTSSDLISMIEQNQLLILGAIVLLAAVTIAVALRGRRKPTSTQPTGTSVTTGMVYCGKCGTQNPTTNDFCAKCGTKLH